MKNNKIKVMTLDDKGFNKQVEKYLENYILLPRESLKYGLKPNELLVYLLLFDRVKLSISKLKNEGITTFTEKIDGEIYPFCLYTREALGEELGCDVKTISNITNKLVEKGFILKRNYKSNTLKKPNQYFICPLPVLEEVDKAMKKKLTKEIEEIINEYNHLIYLVEKDKGKNSEEYTNFKRGKCEYFNFDESIEREIENLKSLKNNMESRLQGAAIYYNQITDIKTQIENIF